MPPTKIPGRFLGAQNVVSVLPPAGSAGRIVFLTPDTSFYGDNGTVWQNMSSPTKISFPEAPFIDLNADSLSVADGASIATAADSSGNGRNGSGATGANPTMQLVAGAKTFRFQADRYFNLPSLASLTEGEVIAVLKVDAAPPADFYHSGLWNLGTDTANTHYPYSDGIIYDIFGSTARKTIGYSPTTLTNWHIYSAYSKTNDWKNFINGTQLFATTTNTVGFPSAPKLGQALPGDVSLYGNIKRFLVFPHAMTTAQRAAVIASLKQTYSIA